MTQPLTQQGSNDQLNIPIFPLPVFLLPNGITRLRIFEPRYLKMVSIASQAHGFALLYQTKEQPAPKWASWVEIINFDQQEGLLIIDIKCKSLVAISDLTPDEDQLNFANIEPIKHWPHAESDTLTEKLSLSLQGAFNDHQSLQTLYQDDPHFQQVFNQQPHHFDANWVVARWLEILPLEPKVKNIFTKRDSFDQAKTFLLSIIAKENNT